MDDIDVAQRYSEPADQSELAVAEDFVSFLSFPRPWGHKFACRLGNGTLDARSVRFTDSIQIFRYLLHFCLLYKSSTQGQFLVQAPYLHPLATKLVTSGKVRSPTLGWHSVTMDSAGVGLGNHFHLFASVWET